MVNRIENLLDKRAGGAFENPNDRVGWLVWGSGPCEGTPFGELAKRVGWLEVANHPFADHPTFEPDVEWAVVMVCTYAELEPVTRDGPTEGACEIKGFGSEAAPGFDRQKPSES